MGEIKLNKRMKLLVFSLLGMLLLSGCHANENNNVFQYKGSFVGDNSAVVNIANQLPGAEHLNEFELKTNEEPYGIILNYDWTEPEQEYKEIVIQNATFLFALVQNVDWVTFNSDTLEYTITKEELQDWLGKELSSIQNEDELRKLLQKHLEDYNRVSQLFS